MVKETVTIKTPGGTQKTIELTDETITVVKIGKAVVFLSLGDINEILAKPAEIPED